MKKVVIILATFMFLANTAEALSCVDLPKNLVRGAESEDVLSLQNFLYEKGLLKAKPNGYFGPGTASAVRSYQKSIGLSQSGQVFPLTRAALKKATCTTAGTSNTTSAVKATTTTTTKPTASTTTTTKATTTTTTVVTTTPKKLTDAEVRQADVTSILLALYKAYRETSAYPVSYTDTAQELCTLGISECTDLVEIKSRIVPKFLPKIPTDPSLGTSTKSGYTIFRSRESNDITIASTYKIGFVPITATCNFVAGCILKETDTTQKKPEITSLDNTTFLYNGQLTAPLIITGKNFTAASNTVYLTSEVNRKVYTLGTFSSTDGVKISATSSFTYGELPCGPSCNEKLPLGSFLVSVKNAGGESNTTRLNLRSITAKAIPNSPDTTFTPKTTHRKLATVSISSEDLITLENLEFTMVGSSTITSKITNFTLTDLLTGSIVSGGPKFTLGSKSLSNNNSKIYELYADIGEVETHLGGRVTFKGAFKIKGNLNKNTATVPVDSFLITVSY